jgi:hypothetical protein
MMHGHASGHNQRSPAPNTMLIELDNPIEHLRIALDAQMHRSHQHAMGEGQGS